MHLCVHALFTIFTGVVAPRDGVRRRFLHKGGLTVWTVTMQPAEQRRGEGEVRKHLKQAYTLKATKKRTCVPLKMWASTHTTVLP